MATEKKARTAMPPAEAVATAAAGAALAAMAAVASSAAPAASSAAVAAAATTSADVSRLRRLPMQARGYTACGSIPSTAARWIDEGSIERLNTNVGAAESGINISTPYKCLPNTLAILATLFERQSAERVAVAFEQPDRMPQTAHWAGLLDHAAHLRG